MDASKQFDSRFNYQKIFVKSSQVDSIADSGSTGGLPVEVTITHNLDYIPSVRVWYDPGNGRRFPIGEGQYDDYDSGVDETNRVTVDHSYLTTTQLVIGYLNASGSTQNVTTYYRIYYDN